MATILFLVPVSSFSDYTDQELTDLLKQSNRKAFNEIYARYWKKMLLVAWNHGRNKHVAKDIVQEVFISLWEKRDLIEIYNLPAFLATSVKFQVFRNYQKELRRTELAKQNYRFEDIVLDESTLDARFLQEFINGIVEDMPERCKLVFHYSRNLGLKNFEIAERVNIAEKSVENTLTRALKIIRCELKNHGISLIIVLKTILLLQK